MKIKIIVSKLISAAKIGSFLLLATITCNAYAEYYLVYSQPNVDCCYGCCYGCRHPCYHRYHRYHRYYHRYYRCYSHYRAPYRTGSGEMQAYAWIGDP